MGKITLSGALPPDVQNGLAADALVKEFLATPDKAVLVVGLLVNAKTVVNHRNGGEAYPVLQFVHWEAAPAEHRQAVADALGAALAARTGAAELPFAPDADVPPVDGAALAEEADR